MGDTRKNNPKHSLHKPLTRIDREIALFAATTKLKPREMAERLGIHQTTAYESLYKPNVQQYIAMLVAERERVLIEQSVALLIAEQHEEYEARKRENDERRARDRRRKAAR